jgi:2-polyprenyl-3-methyl-5-hydroxy-6-metoxy-1,4-benzoquinol methylase
MYEKISTCPVCKNGHIRNHTIITDHSISKESFAINSCNECDLLFTNPRPDQDNIWKFYDDSQYISHTNKTQTLKDIIYKLVRLYTTNQKINLIHKYSHKPTIIDYGCGSGYFLKQVLKNNNNAKGIEPAKSKTIPKTSLIYNYVYESIEEINKNEKVDIITAWHVVEHIHELTQTLKQLKKRLNKKGYLIIAVPNHLSFDAKYYKEQWAGYDVPRHLYHFSQKCIHRLAKEIKMKVMAIHPMYFDAYYVSMLSEQYRHSSHSFLKGLKIGYQSNKKAKQNGEYSSLIYVLRK